MCFDLAPGGLEGVLSGEQECWSVEASKVMPSYQRLGYPKSRFKFCGRSDGSI